VAFWVAGGIFAIVAAYPQVVNTLKSYLDLLWVFGLVGTWWYLFRKGNVVSYYRELEARDRE
jgi:hypothetical protein